MSTHGDVELNGNPTEFSNEEEIKMKLLKTTGNVKLHILDDQGLQDLKDEAISKIEDVEAELDKKLENTKAEIDKSIADGDTQSVEAANQYTDNRVDALSQNLTNKGEKLKETLEKTIEHIKNIDKNTDSKIDTKVDALKQELEPKIEANKTLSEENKAKVDQLRKDVDFNMQGTMRLVALLNETSTNIEAMPNKDDYLTSEVKKNGLISLVSGYFVRCSDEVCYFYVNNTWHKGKAAGQTFNVDAPLTFTNGNIGLAIDTNSGLSVDQGSNSLTFNPANNNVFDSYTKKDQTETISAVWTFQEPVKSTKEATNDDELVNFGQFKKLVEEAVKQGAKVTYTGTSPIEIDTKTNTVSLKLDPNGHLKATTDGLALELTGITTDAVFENFTRKDQDEVIGNEWTFNLPPKSMQEANDDKDVPNWGQVKQEIKDQVTAGGGNPGQGGQQPGQGVTYTAQAPLVIDAQNQISLSIKTDSGLILDNNQLSIDPTKFNPGNVGGNTKEYTGEGAIEVDNTGNTIKINVDETTGLKIEDGKLKFDGKAGNGGAGGNGNGNNQGGGQVPGGVDLSNYTQKTEDEIIEGEWQFNTPPKSTQEANEDHDIPNWKQVQDEIKKGAGNNPGNGGVGGGNTPDLTDYANKKKAETIEKEWTFNKAPSSAQDATDDDHLPTYKQVKDLVAGGVGNIPDIGNILDETKKEVDKIVDQGKAEINTTAAGHVTMIQTLGKQTEEEIKKLAEGAVKHSNLTYDNTKSRLEQESRAQQIALAELAERKMAEFRRISHPMERETITFSTLDPVASGRNNIVGFQKVVVDMTGKIIKYGDMMVKGGESNSYRCDPNAKKSSRLNFPTSEIEFDRWTFNFISFAAIPKRGQRANLHAMGYEGFDVDEDIDLDNVVFFLGNNDSGQFGTGNKTIYRKAVPIKFEDKIKHVLITEWNQGGNSAAVQTFVLLDNGKLYGAGRNDSGQFGLGNTTESTKFIELKDNVDELVGESYGSITYIKDKQGAYWKAGSKGYDFGDATEAWRQISSKNCSHLHYFSDWNGSRGYATELWFDNDKEMWMGRGNNDYYQRDVDGKNTKPNEQHNYLTLNRIRDKLLHVYNYPLSIYALSATTLYSWGHRPYPFNTSWSGDQANFKGAREAELPLPNVEYEMIQFRQSTTTSSYKTSLCLYYPSVHRLFYAGTIIGSFGLVDNVEHHTWKEIDLPPKRNPDSVTEIRYFVWNTYYQLAIIQEGKLYLAGEGTVGSFFEPKTSLFNEQQI